MKKHSNILILSLFTLLLASCSKENVGIGGDENVNENFNKSYILFDVDVATRGTLIEDTILKDNFYVIGYQYRGDWNTYKVMATPNVFYKDQQSTQLALPQTVTYNKGTNLYTYSPIQAWTGNSYSFFAYYPVISQNSPIVLFDDGTTLKQGVPYITYTLPNSSDPRTLIDVMTAKYIDTGIDFSPSVNLNMYHRLSGVDISAHNYYKVDHDNNQDTPDIDAIIKITNLKVDLENVNTVAKIYLDDSERVYSSPGKRSYQLVGNTGSADWSLSYIDIKPSNSNGDEGEGNNNIKETLITNPSSTSLILIPQTNELSFKLALTYQVGYYNNNQWVTLRTVNNSGANNLLSGTFNVPLTEGRRYYLDLTFTSDAVTISIDPASEWVDKDVIHEFE